jgi:hypothetical protein
MREPALAMLMGALPQGDHFGFGAQFQEPQVGFGDDYGYGDDGYGYGDDGYGYGDDGYGYGYGYGFGLASAFDPSMNIGLPGMGWGWGAAPAGPAAPPPPAAMMRRGPMPRMVRRPMPMAPRPPMHPAAAAAAAQRFELANPASTMSRTMLLDPNRDSKVKVERYSFSFSPTANLVLGTASNIPTFTQQPSTSIKGQRVVMNAPIAGFVLISSLQIANVNVLVGGTEDAFTYSAGAQGVMLDLPRLDPQNRATSAGAYTGVLPTGYTQGNSFQFIITLQGPATLAGGYGQ